MERILWLYGLEYNPLRPVLCYDERPCFLIGEMVEGLPLKEGRIARQHYAYEKNGSCSLLATIEPLTGKRIMEVCDQRRKIEFARHFQKVAAAYPEAEKIVVILDNLNTHSASWLNMIEIEFSALSRQCLGGRIPSKEKLTTAVLSLAKKRQEKQIKIEWQFSIQTAREKLNRHYKKVNEKNVIH